MGPRSAGNNLGIFQYSEDSDSDTTILQNLYRSVTFADYYLRVNIEFRNKACTRGKYYSYTKLYFVLFVLIYVYSHMYVRHVLAVALASLP